MPPKKKTRLPPRAISTPSGDSLKLVGERAQTPSVKNDVAKAGVLLDAWTDEQETSLFKGMIRWKPVGLFIYQKAFYRAHDIADRKLIRHAQTFPDDSHFPESQKPWLHLTTRRPYTNTLHMGETGQPL